MKIRSLEAVILVPLEHLAKVCRTPLCQLDDFFLYICLRLYHKGGKLYKSLVWVDSTMYETRADFEVRFKTKHYLNYHLDS